MKKQQKGITLIALVITIIILLILAGVTLNIVLNGGMIEKSQTATEKYKIEEYREDIELIKVECYLKKITEKPSKTVKELVIDELNELKDSWVKEVITEGLDENEIKVITKEEYEIITEINNGNETGSNPGEGTDDTETPEEVGNKPELSTISVSDRNTDYITISANATDLDADNLTYKLYLRKEDGTYSNTPNVTSTETASGTAVTLNATGLDTYTVYKYKVEVTDGKSTVTSEEGTTGTGCNEIVTQTCTDATKCVKNKTTICTGRLGTPITGTANCNNHGTTYYYYTYYCSACSRTFGYTDPPDCCSSEEGSLGDTTHTVSCCVHGNTGTHYYCNNHSVSCGSTSSHSYEACEHDETELHFPN